MSRGRKKHRPTPEVVVCQGCGLDDGHLVSLRRATRRAGGACQVSDCLGACEHATVVVVRSGGRGGSSPFWLGGAFEDPMFAELVEWVAQGGPEIAEPPPDIAEHEFRPPRSAQLPNR